MKIINISLSTEADRNRIAELAQLDGQPAPQGEALIAEVDGRLVAAVGVKDGVSVADPFVLTEDTLELLKVRAEEERELRYGKGPLLGRLMLIRQRAGMRCVSPRPSLRSNTSELCRRPTSLRSMRPHTSSRISFMSRTATWAMKSVVPVRAITRTVSGRAARSPNSFSVAWRCSPRCWIDRIASIGRPMAAGSIAA